MPRARIRSILPTAFILLLVLVACDDSSTGPLPSSAITITPGVALTNLSGGERSRTLYKVVVPAGTDVLIVETHGGSGDVDLLVRRGRVPTFAAADCDSFNGDNDDACFIDNPAAGDYYIMLYGAGDAGYSGTTLLATFAVP